MGGELLNPGAVEMSTLSSLTRRGGPEVVAGAMPLNFLACTTALLVYWLMAELRKRRGEPVATGVADRAEIRDDAKPFRINPIKAMVPVLPLVLFFAVTGTPSKYLRENFKAPAPLLAALLIGVAAAGLTAPRKAGQLSSAFFEGAGYAYTHVISLIVTATVFAEGVRESGLIAELTAFLARWPAAATVACVALPWALAYVSGTGIAPAVAIMNFFVPVAGELGHDPVRLGALSAMGAHFGRTMSPAAAVVAMSAKLSHAEPGDLVREVFPPLLAGGVVLVLGVMLRLV
jgi:DcuC family C4-dicarboxylate transporter